MTLHVLIDQARTLLEQDGIEPRFGDIEDAVYQDLDFEYLYDLRFDGVEDSDPSAELGIDLLYFDKRPDPFEDAVRPVHPYSRGVPVD